MKWTEEPATQTQLSHLSQLGYESVQTLTKGEAAHLISELEEHPEKQRLLSEIREQSKPDAFRFRQDVEAARRALAQAEPEQMVSLQSALSTAIAKRREFWLDTLGEAARMSSVQAHDLHQKHGCRFVVPEQREVQDVLDALDPAMPTWDRDHPELFFQTLELNFPELVRRW